MSEAPKTILDEMQASITEENFLGNGSFRAVFKFSDERLKGYVFSIPNSAAYYVPARQVVAEARVSLSRANSSHLLQAFDDFLSEREFGTPIMEIPNTRITIMPCVQGHDLQATLNEMGYEAFTRMMAKLPQSAYTQLFSDVRFLHEQGYRPDLNSGNIMLDTVQEKLTIIDLDRRVDVALSSNLILSGICPRLVHGSLWDKVTVPRRAIPNVRTALEKMIVAAEEAGLPCSEKIHENERLQRLTEALRYKSKKHRAICDRLDAVAFPLVSEFRPKATIECIAPLRLDAPTSDLMATIADIRAHHANQHAHV